MAFYDVNNDDDVYFNPYLPSTSSPISPPFSDFGTHSLNGPGFKFNGILGNEISWRDEAAILEALEEDDDAGIAKNFYPKKGNFTSAESDSGNSLVPANGIRIKNGASDSAKRGEKRKGGGDGMSLVDPQWEIIDPTPDIWSLFNQFNKEYFWGKLTSVEVKWSTQMMSCAGICRYESRAGYCSIGLSFPLLKFRPRKDLIETLLHEMIHAYLFVTKNDRDRDGHGPFFHEHMFRLNKETGTKISVYHSFHDEVNHYKTHIWRCDGPCRSQKPYQGFVKRSRNRAPSKNDLWWADHQAKCGGTFVKIHEPDGFGIRKKKKSAQDQPQKPRPATQKTLDGFQGFRSPEKRRKKPTKVDVGSLGTKLPKSPVKRQTILTLTNPTTNTNASGSRALSVFSESANYIDLTVSPPVSKKPRISPFMSSLSSSTFPGSAPRRQLQLNSFFPKTSKPVSVRRAEVQVTGKPDILCIDL